MMFETIEIKEFGKYLRQVRKQLSLTQTDVENMSGITPDGLRRIENGYGIPRYETIVLLSLAYKKDLFEDLKRYRNSSPLFDYYKRLNCLILEYNEDKLKQLELDFQNFYKTSKESTYINAKIENQILKLIKSIELLNNGDSNGSISYAKAALCETNKSFELSEYNMFKYTYIETRILGIIAHAIAYSDPKYSTDIYKFCLKFCNFDSEAAESDKLNIINIFFNLAYNSHLVDNHLQSIKYAEDGIKYCNDNHLSYGLAGLTFRKGLAEFHLERDNYAATLKSSVYTLIATGKVQLANMYIDILRMQYSIDFDI